MSSNREQGGQIAAFEEAGDRIASHKKALAVGPSQAIVSIPGKQSPETTPFDGETPLAKERPHHHFRPNFSPPLERPTPPFNGWFDFCRIFFGIGAASAGSSSSFLVGSRAGIACFIERLIR